MEFASNIVDSSQKSLWIALFSVTFNPLAWNIVARNEFHHKSITRFFAGNARLGCYFLAGLIFLFGLLRDTLYHAALQNQPSVPLSSLIYPLVGKVDFASQFKPSDVDYFLHTLLPAVLFVTGQTFVLTSTYALGITGTFLGDYFGILMDARVTGFPFNVLDNPMYIGSTLCFAATALWYQKPAGLIVTAYVYIVYKIALRFEEPFTAMIYSRRAEKSSNGFSEGKKAQ